MDLHHFHLFIRCINSIVSMQDVLSAVDEDATLDVLDHPILNVIYYMVAYQAFLLSS